jgi:hypothetical protein
MPGPGTWSAGDILTASDLNAIGVWTAYTPTLEQNGVITTTVNYAEFCQINKLVFCNVDLTCTTTGSAGNAITVSLPTSFTGGLFCWGQFFDSSASDVRLVTGVVVGSNLGFYADASSTNVLGISPSVALGNNDVISFSVIYRSV